MGDAPVLMKVANPSSQDRTPRGAIVLAVSPTARPYRASGLVPWLLAEASSDLRRLETLGWSLRPLKEKAD
jgi:hypothetical protein